LLTPPKGHWKALFSPEHGIRGAVDEKVGDSTDETTGLPVYSLYGARRKPIPEQLENLDAIVFDYSGGGLRFLYLHLDSWHVLEAARDASLKCFVSIASTRSPIDRGRPILKGESSFTGSSDSRALWDDGRRIGSDVQRRTRLFRRSDVIGIQNWKREMWFDETGLPWTIPHPICGP